MPSDAQGATPPTLAVDQAVSGGGGARRIARAQPCLVFNAVHPPFVTAQLTHICESTSAIAAVPRQLKWARHCHSGGVGVQEVVPRP